MLGSDFRRQSFQRAFIVLAAALLVGCDEWIDDFRSDGGQEFRKFSPQVKTPEPPKPPSTPPASSSSNSSSSNSGGSKSGSSSGSSSSGQSSGSSESNTSSSSSSSSGGDPNIPPLAPTGIVWKPVSEGDHKLVVLTPTSYGTPSIAVLDSAGRTVEKGRYVGHTNGNRATYRFSRPGSGYSAPAFLRVNSSVYRVDNPAGRVN